MAAEAWPSKLRGWADAASRGARFSAPAVVLEGRLRAAECPRAGAVGLLPSGGGSRQKRAVYRPFPGILAGGLFGTTLRLHPAGPVDFPLRVRLPVVEREAV